MAQTTSINSELYTALLGDAQYAAYESSIARQLVTVFDMPANSGTTINVPVWATVGAAELTEGVAPSAADTNTTSVAIAVGEVGTYFPVTDFLRDSAHGNVIAELGSQAGRAIAEKIDNKVFALFNSITQSVGTEDSAITIDNLLDAIATIRGNKVTGPIHAVLGPRQALQIRKALVNAGTSAAPQVAGTANAYGSAVLERGWLGQLGGANIWESALVKSDLNTDSDSELNMVGAVFAPSCIGHVMRGGVKMKTEDKASTRSTDIMMSVDVGEAILQASHGVKIVGSSTD